MWWFVTVMVVVCGGSSSQNGKPRWALNHSRLISFGSSVFLFWHLLCHVVRARCLDSCGFSSCLVLVRLVRVLKSHNPGFAFSWLLPWRRCWFRIQQWLGFLGVSFWCLLLVSIQLVVEVAGALLGVFKG